MNKVLSQSNREGYSTSLNLVQKAIDALIKYKVDQCTRYIPYEIAYQIVDEAISGYIDRRGFIDELVVEGVLSKNLFWKDNNEHEEGIFVVYERFEDHLTAKYLIDQHPNLEREFKKDGKLWAYVRDETAAYVHKGLLEALSILVPEIKGKELYVFIPQIKEKIPVIESFIESLLWRRPDTVNKNSVDYVNKYVLPSGHSYNLFWETILAVTAVPDHYFNAVSLHNHLMTFSLADRDADWSQFLKHRFAQGSSVKRLIDWAWSDTDKSHISDESVKLAGITLAWFHTSSNRELRDSATKALVSLLQNRINVLLEILKTFEKVNDPYVYERLFAVAYGTIIRSNDTQGVVDLCSYVHHVIFNKEDEIYPHILLRDYSRGVIEYAVHLGIELPFDPSSARPPYKSSFPDHVMTNDEIDEKYDHDYKGEDFKDYFWSQNAILSSMTTEYGRGGGGYGDFGRYTFESAFRSWDVVADKLSNIAVEWIFEKYGYDVEKHGRFDRDRDSYTRRASTIERIGKKYQWLAFYEMLARVSDNFTRYDTWDFNREKEVPYQGPWDPYVRDIDPTMVINNTGRYDSEKMEEFWWTDKAVFDWTVKNKTWLNQSDDLPEFAGLISVKDTEGVEWLVLEGYPSWSQPKSIGEEKWDYPHKHMWCHLRSYLVRENEYNKFKEWAVKQDFMGRWMPESGDRYEMFSREYFWSPAEDYFMQEYFNGTECVESDQFGSFDLNK